MVPRGRSETLASIGLDGADWWHDLYYRALTISWPRFLGISVAIYLAANLMFATLYLLQPGAIGEARAGDFGDAFFFSVQTMATIGYGKLVPATVYANILVTFQTVFAILVLALTTGLMFARFSRPTARVLFSRYAVIGPYNGQPTFSLRIANQRRNQIVQAEVSLTVLRTETTQEGGSMRRFYELRLARQRTPIFAMTFQVMHPIDEESPLFGATPDSLAADEAEFVVTVTGLDAAMSQNVHANYSYTYEEVRWDHKLVDIFGYTESGHPAIDFRRFHDVQPLAAAAD